DQLVFFQPGAGGVIRIGDEDDAGTVINGGGHGIEIVAKVFRRYINAFGTNHFGHQTINSEGVLRSHHVVAVVHKNPGNKIEDIAGAVAQYNLLRLNAELVTQ